MTPVFGGTERSALPSLPSFNGPITTRSETTDSREGHKSLVTTESPGSWRSICQHAVNSRANSASSVRISTLVVRKGTRSLTVFHACQLHSRELELFRLFQTRQQALGADAQIHGSLRVFGLLGDFDAFLKP